MREKNLRQISYSQSTSSLSLRVFTILEPGTTGQTPVVQKVDSAIHGINLYPLDSAIVFPNIYPLNRDLFDGQRYRCLVSRPHYFARPNFGSRGLLVRLGYVTVNAEQGLERYPTFEQLGPNCQKRKQMQRTKKSRTCLFSRVMIGLILLKFALIKNFQVFLHRPIAASSSGASFFARQRRATSEEPQGNMGRIHSRCPFPASGYEADPIAFHLCFILIHDPRISES